MVENKEKTRVESSSEKNALSYEYASVNVVSWYEEVINTLDEPLSILLSQGSLTTVGLDRIFHDWHEENGQIAQQILWAFVQQYEHVFGFLIADLKEDGELEQVALFYAAIDRERERVRN